MKRNSILNKKKNNTGITLVVLIITIIVLLILAVVAIRAVQGDGIINHAKNARDNYNRAQIEENTTLQNYMDYIEKNLDAVEKQSKISFSVKVIDFTDEPVITKFEVQENSWSDELWFKVCDTVFSECERYSKEGYPGVDQFNTSSFGELMMNEGGGVITRAHLWNPGRSEVKSAEEIKDGYMYLIDFHEFWDRNSKVGEIMCVKESTSYEFKRILRRVKS